MQFYSVVALLNCLVASMLLNNIFKSLFNRWRSGVRHFIVKNVVFAQLCGQQRVLFFLTDRALLDLVQLLHLSLMVLNDFLVRARSDQGIFSGGVLAHKVWTRGVLRAWEFHHFGRVASGLLSVDLKRSLLFAGQRFGAALMGETGAGTVLGKRNLLCWLMDRLLVFNNWL